MQIHGENSFFMVEMSYEPLELRILQKGSKIGRCAICLKWKRYTD